MRPALPAPHKAPLLQRVLAHRVWGVILPLAITIIAMFVLHRMSQNIKLADVKNDAQTYPLATLALSFAAMCLSYLALSLYDVIILRDVTEVKLPVAVPLMTGVSSMAISNMLGFSWLTGGAVRFRIYSAFGIDISAVARLIATSWIAFFVGLLALMGGLMIAHPKGLSEVISLSKGVETTLGLALITAIAAFFLWTAKTRRSIGFGSYKMDLPLAAEGLKITAISIVDLTATALVLYVLMPADLSQNFVFFFVIFVAAVALGILSHSPGGLGVFEATIIAGLGASGRSDALAALVMYRVIYTALPFLLSVLGLAIAWVLANRQKATQSTKLLQTAIAPVVPLVAAGLVMLSGAVLLISGSLPSDPARLCFLRELLPLPMLETSHLLGSISGVLLLIVARGLYRRMFRAWLLAMSLLFVGLLLSFLKGFSWEEGLSLAGAMIVLWVFRSAFYRAHVAAGMRLSWPWILSVILLVGSD